MHKDFTDKMNEYVDVDLYGPRITVDVQIQVRGFNILQLMDSFVS